MSVEPQESAKEPTCVIVYVGHCTVTGGKQGHEYRTVEGWPDAPVLGKSWAFGKALAKYDSPGTVRETAMPSPSQLRREGKYLGEWPDEAQRDEWQAAHDAAKRAAAAAKFEASPARRRAYLEHLKPVADAYRRLPAPLRAQMLARVVEYIVKGG